MKRRGRSKSGRFTKGGKRKGTIHSARRKARRTTARRSAPRAAAAPAPKARIRYYSRPSRRVKVRGRRSVNVRSQRARTGRVVGAAIGGVVAGAMLGSLANEGGLLQAMPTQNKTGIGVGGLTGLVLVIIGFFVKSEGLKLLFYGLGGGLIVEEVTRQLETRGYDFRVAFYGAPALDYTHGVAGAVAQLRAYEATNLAAQLPGGQGNPAQLPPGAPPAKLFQKAPASQRALTASEEDSVQSLMLQNGTSYADQKSDWLSFHPVASQGVGYDRSAGARFALRRVA